MNDNIPKLVVGRPRLPLAVILGTNEIASAVAVHLRKVGFGVVLSHDPMPPVMRRGMAFHDALFGEAPMIEGVAGYGVERAFDVMAVINASDRMRVAVTRLGLCDLLAIRSIAVLIDARMQKHMVTPDLSHLAGITVGLGPGFEVGGNCDVAVETRPARIGQVVQQGATDEADGKPPSLGGAGRERFVYARSSGLWRTAFDIGTQVRAGAALGYLADRAVIAPMDGTLRGIVRDATTVPSGAKLSRSTRAGKRAGSASTSAAAVLRWRRREQLRSRQTVMRAART